MRGSLFPSGHGQGLPRVPQGDPAAAARALAEMIPAVIAEAEALGVAEVAGYLRMALLVAERRATEGRTDRLLERGEGAW